MSILFCRLTSVMLYWHFKVTMYNMQVRTYWKTATADVSFPCWNKMRLNFIYVCNWQSVLSNNSTFSSEGFTLKDRSCYFTFSLCWFAPGHVEHNQVVEFYMQCMYKFNATVEIYKYIIRKEGTTGTCLITVTELCLVRLKRLCKYPDSLTHPHIIYI